MGAIHQTTYACAEALGRQHGLTGAEVIRAIEWAKVAKTASERAADKPQDQPRAKWDFARAPEPRDGKAMCAQCDRRVTVEEACRCLSRFCKAKAAVFETAEPTP